MADFTRVIEALRQRGYSVRSFADGEAAADYLCGEIQGKTVGLGGSCTLRDLGIYERLTANNTVYWHWQQEPDEARKKSMDAQIYLTSANALAETGEIVNIDGAGNRVASTLYGHEKVYFLIGRNKLCPSAEEALWRARNVAAPRRAQQMGRKTPCAEKAERCYDCRSPERICRALVVFWEKPAGSDQMEVVLVDEPLGY